MLFKYLYFCVFAESTNFQINLIMLVLVMTSQLSNWCFDLEYVKLLSQEWIVTFPWSKKILRLWIKSYIFRNCCYLARTTFKITEKIMIKMFDRLCNRANLKSDFL